MANYMNQLVDPNKYSQQNMNNLMNVMQLREGRRRTDLMEKQDARRKQEFDIKMMTVPFEYTKIKSRHVAQAAHKISALPPAQRAKQYNNLVNKLVPTPIAEHPQLGKLGVLPQEHFLGPDEFVKLDDAKQRQYLKMISTTATEASKLNLADKKAALKERELLLKAKNELEKIRAQEKSDISVEKVKQTGRMELEKSKQRGGPAADKRQNRIDKYQKEVARLATVREKIRKGDDLFKIGQIMARVSGDQSLATNKDEGVESALKKVDQYEKWLRKRLKKLETKSTDDDPLGLFK